MINQELVKKDFDRFISNSYISEFNQESSPSPSINTSTYNNNVISILLNSLKSNSYISSQFASIKNSSNSRPSLPPVISDDNNFTVGFNKSKTSNTVNNPWFSFGNYATINNISEDKYHVTDSITVWDLGNYITGNIMNVSYLKESDTCGNVYKIQYKASRLTYNVGSVIMYSKFNDTDVLSLNLTYSSSGSDSIKFNSNNGYLSINNNFICNCNTPILLQIIYDKNNNYIYILNNDKIMYSFKLKSQIQEFTLDSNKGFKTNAIYACWNDSDLMNKSKQDSFPRIYDKTFKINNFEENNSNGFYAFNSNNKIGYSPLTQLALKEYPNTMNYRIEDLDVINNLKFIGNIDDEIVITENRKDRYQLAFSVSKIGGSSTNITITIYDYSGKIKNFIGLGCAFTFVKDSKEYEINSLITGQSNKTSQTVQLTLALEQGQIPPNPQNGSIKNNEIYVYVDLKSLRYYINDSDNYAEFSLKNNTGKMVLTNSKPIYSNKVFIKLTIGTGGYNPNLYEYYRKNIEVSGRIKITYQQISNTLEDYLDNSIDRRFMAFLNNVKDKRIDYTSNLGSEFCIHLIRLNDSLNIGINDSFVEFKTNPVDISASIIINITELNKTLEDKIISVNSIELLTESNISLWNKNWLNPIFELDSNNLKDQFLKLKFDFMREGDVYVY